MNPAHKPCALLRGMAERQGQKITARDVAALELAIQTMKVMHQERQNLFECYRDDMAEAVAQKARGEALLDGLQALLSTHL